MICCFCFKCSGELAFSHGWHEGLVYPRLIIKFAFFFAHPTIWVKTTFQSLEALFAPFFLILRDHISDIELVKHGHVDLLLGEAYILHPCLQPFSHIFLRLFKGVWQFFDLFSHIGESIVLFFNQILLFLEEFLHNVIIQQLMLDVLELPFLIFEVSELLIRQLITLLDPFAEDSK